MQILNSTFIEVLQQSVDKSHYVILSPHSLLTDSRLFFFFLSNLPVLLKEPNRHTSLREEGERGNGSSLNRTGSVTVHMTKCNVCPFQCFIAGYCRVHIRCPVFNWRFIQIYIIFILYMFVSEFQLHSNAMQLTNSHNVSHRFCYKMPFNLSFRVPGGRGRPR